MADYRRVLAQNVKEGSVVTARYDKEQEKILFDIAPGEKKEKKSKTTNNDDEKKDAA